MPRREQTVELLTLNLDKGSPESLHLQLDQQIRRLILEGRLKQGARLPPSRQLAKELGCSRNTVLSTFEQLKAEGFLTGSTGAGTFVASDIDVDLLASPRRRKEGAGVSREPKLSSVGLALRRVKRTPSLLGRPFSLAGPDVKLFPADIWARISARAWRHSPLDILRCDDPAGYMPLREAIATHLHNARDISCNARQIIITAGATQALDLMVRLLAEEGDPIWVEDPCFVTGTNVLTAAHSTIVPVPVDEQGLVVEEGIRLAPGARMAMVTPSHQFPLGVVMSLKRRLALLEWANEADAWVLEDDYDSEFRYVGRPLPTLHSLDKNERVIYIGTFSKVLFESLRLGYVVLPGHLADRVIEARGNLEQSVPVPMQPMLARFIEEGHFAAHVHRMRRIYAARREAVVSCGQKYLGGLLEFSGDQSGLHVVASFTAALAERMSLDEAVAEAEKHGVALTRLSHYYSGKAPAPAVVIGYGSVSDDKIEPAMRALARALEA
jgi:GntR family transcriptional regulator/MocR family aminotransferase